MVVAPGTRLGAYEIIALIGSGGMGEVYQARDSRLDRTVAVKILHAHVSSDTALKERFHREAKALAALNHPHICSVYDVGEAAIQQGLVQFLVMEHLEGETLAARLTRGPLPLSDVVVYGVQISNALERAHRQGIVHRDLKPGNIMLGASGAKLLDFGLATINPARSDLASAVTSLTGVGMVVGTLQYMAPEQLEAQRVDARTDIFALGAVLYEMVTGKRAFERNNQASVISAILKEEPTPISTLQPTLTPVLGQIIQTCLEKNPDRRWQSAADVGRQLQLVPEDRSQSPAAGTRPAARGRSLSSWLVPAAAAAAAAIVVGLSVWTFSRPTTSKAPLVSRLLLTPSPQAPLVSVGGFDVAISPDGTRVVYLGETSAGGRALYVRELSGLEPRMIEGTQVPANFENANPSFSWNGQSIVFRSAGKGILRVALAGGTPTKLLDDEPGFVGAAWGPDESLVVALVRAGGENGLYRISVNGKGKLERLTPSVRQDVLYTAPSMLPGGEAVLFGLIGLGDQTERVAVLDLRTREQRILVDGGASPLYSSSGHVLFARGTVIMAAAFDPNRLEIQGVPMSVLPGVRHPALPTAADYALSRNGNLIYVPNADADSGRYRYRPTWVDRSGRAAGPAVDGQIESPLGLELSPDGRLLLTAAPDGIAVNDLSGRPSLPLVSPGKGTDISPIWSPDGKQVFFASSRDRLTSFALYSIPSDGGSLEPRPVPISNQDAFGDPLGSLILPLTWLPDGRLVVAITRVTGGGGDILSVSAAGGEAQVLTRTEYAEDSARISPNGRWLAYRSSRSGTDEIWVQPVSGGAPVRVSQNGGRQPVWSRNGRELFYIEGRKMMSLALRSGSDFAFESPVVLFEWPAPQSVVGFTDLRSYDVAGDGRFLMLASVKEPAPAAIDAAAGIVVVQNWHEELGRLVPAADRFRR
jgi:serine/threonine-protein kinase